MGAKTDISLRNFFIFNPLFGPKEEQELMKILFYHPITDTVDVQIKAMGLVEGILQFSGTFKPNAEVSSLYTQKTRQLFYQPEKSFWMVMTLNVPFSTNTKEGASQNEYYEDDIQDNVYAAILKQSYLMYRLFWNTFETTVTNESLGLLKTRLEHFFNAYIKTLKLAQADILNVFNGIQYLPLDKLTFLKVHSFVNVVESNYPCVKYTAFLYNNHLIWSGVNPKDMQIIYQYLVGTLLPANMEAELQGGSMPRNSPSPFAALHHGRFITGPNNLKNAKTIGKVPKIYIFHEAELSSYHFLVYRALSASVCLLVSSDFDLTLDFFKELDNFISPKLTAVVHTIGDYCSKQALTPSNIPDGSPKFIYFNKHNLAYKSTVHLDNQLGNANTRKEALKVMADLNKINEEMEDPGEITVRMANDYWIVSKVSNAREVYIVEQQQNSSLIEINKDVNALCDEELKGIFFNPL